MDGIKNVDALRAELVKRLQVVESESLLLEVREILDLHSPSRDWWDELTEIQKGRVRQGIQELNQGLKVSATEVLRRLKR